MTETIILDPVNESYTAHRLDDRVEKFKSGRRIEIAFRPVVTDTVAQELIKASNRIGLVNIQAAATGISYHFEEGPSEAQLHLIARRLLVNETIQHYSLAEMDPDLIFSSPSPDPEIVKIPLIDADDAGLVAMSQDRRLALDIHEMRAAQGFFKAEGREPTDAELETIAQTWSEHCVHKTFKGKVKFGTGEIIDGIIYKYLKAATDQIAAPWVRSAFVDNAGVIEFDDMYDLSFKVETHNHPSAIEPFGGANTGVGGVVRDVLGVSHRPIANTDVLCFGPLNLPYSELAEGVLHPTRIQDGVVAGVGDYGNKLGIPTVNGTIYYHPGYTANPLVFCGCVGIGPIGSHPSAPQPGDRIILLGGKTGRDGLRGATFSSLTMDAQTGEVAGASVQIGDPITEKGLIEVIENARDLGLYNAVTDCGAGGLSSAVGEMSSRIGAQVELSAVPLKYTGLQPWEIWLSEAQERMVLAVPQANVAALQEICDRYWVDLSDIGFFEESGKLVVNFSGEQVVCLSNVFLHEGIPQKELSAGGLPSSISSSMSVPSLRDENDFEGILLALLSHPNIASKETTIRKYDHEVRGATVIKPFAGFNQDGPNDAAVLKPLNTNGWRGFALANGINPLIGVTDPYYMALSVVDEAVRNLVAVGVDPSRIALLDNFCWGDPSRPEIMASLVEAARGCYDAAVYYQSPFISGKDSLNNEFIGRDGKRQAIPGTLLISSIGIVPDVRKAVSMDLKSEGDLIYLVGDWQPTLSGSHLASMDKLAGLVAGSPPGGLSELNLHVYRAIFNATREGLVNALHDLSEGGLAVALAEMCLAGRLGAQVEISMVDEIPSLACFAETNGCLIAAVAPEKAMAFEMKFNGLPCRKLGEISGDDRLLVTDHGTPVLSTGLSSLIQAFAGEPAEGQQDGH